MFYFDRKQYKIVEVSELDVIALLVNLKQILNE